MNMASPTASRLPYRLALAGGWIDQPFVNRLDPGPPGSMVVVSLEPATPFMERAGIATSTRKTAFRLWGDAIPRRDPAGLVRELYAEENRDKAEPSGSQDMAGLVYPGISRLDYDRRYEGGVFPVAVESTADPAVTAWLEGVLQLVPVAPRPAGYDPLGTRNLDPAWIARLGRSGRECFAAIAARDLGRLGASMNECMACWEAILPGTVRHPALTVDLPSLLRRHQADYPGAMYSGCGGGYLIVASAKAVPGALRIRIRTGAGAAAAGRAGVLVTGTFDDLRARTFRFLEEAAKLGEVLAGLRTDAAVRAVEGREPKLPFEERAYILESLRSVSRVVPLDGPPPESVPRLCRSEGLSDWAVTEVMDAPETRALAAACGLVLRPVGAAAVGTVPPPGPLRVDPSPARDRVVVTGSFDWLHSGHIRFLEEAAGYGDVYAGVGSDANIRRLKGPKHPFFPEAERLYLVGAVRHVVRGFVPSGAGWLDAGPELPIVKPRFYIVNEDGDRPEKRRACERAGIEYVVLRRAPRPGLARRDSTTLRGF
jgi:cytidyltransferase-like protein